MSQPSLRVQPEHSDNPALRCFRLEGVIDVEAVPVLEPLYALPAGIEVELDFGAVQRVNSMGLAQLLKLFEQWQAKAIRIRVSHANRMTRMLFKMTGLERFLESESEGGLNRATSVLTGTSASPAKPRPGPTHRPASPSQRPVPTASPAPGLTSIAGGPGQSAPLLEWRVDMASAHQLNGWYFFNTYLQRRLSIPARLQLADPLLGSGERAEAPPDLLFTRPFDAVRLVTEQGYLPLAQPENQSDEVTLLARAEDRRESLQEFAGGRVVAAARDSFVYLLGRYLLDESGVPSAAMQYQFPGHEIKAVQKLLKGEAELLFMHSESYRNLSGMTRRLLKRLDHSEVQFAFHLWCLSPARADLKESLRNVLLAMSDDEHGRTILGELGLSAWVTPEAEDIAMLERIYLLYRDQD